MTNIRETILEANRLTRMRMGQDAPDLVDIPSKEGVRAAQVPLLEKEAQMGMILAASLDVPDNAAGLAARNRAAIESDVWNSLREPSDPSQKVFASVEEMTGALDSSDIDYLADNLMTLMEYASPSLDGLSDKALDELKKALAEADWNGLTGRRWAAVKLCMSILFPDLQVGRSRGTGSTESSTSRSENDEST